MLEGDFRFRRLVTSRWWFLRDIFDDNWIGYFRNDITHRCFKGDFSLFYELKNGDLQRPNASISRTKLEHANEINHTNRDDQFRVTAKPENTILIDLLRWRICKTLKSSSTIIQLLVCTCSCKGDRRDLLFFDCFRLEATMNLQQNSQLCQWSELARSWSMFSFALDDSMMWGISS